jgi:hypothetical protein
MRSRAALLTVVPFAALFASGCAGWPAYVMSPDGAEIRVEGLGESPVRVDGLLPHGAYGSTPSEETAFAGDVPLESLAAGGVKEAQFLHAELIWVPDAGRTPIGPNVTNVVLRYVIVANGEVGLYGGAGFAWPRGTIGSGPLSLVIVGSSMTLLARTDGFVDLLSPAQLTGTVWVPFAPDKARVYRRGVSQLVTDALGVSRWVDGGGQPLTTAEVLALALPEQTGDAAQPGRSSPANAASTAASIGSRPGA